MLYQLDCGYQNYEWGKLGDQSAVAQFAAATAACVGHPFTPDACKPYAELWMGTHPKQPSQVVGKSQNLRQLIEEHPEMLGDAVISKFGAGELPFLFKVLSIAKPLSIQAHPDKALGKILRARDPKNYPDDNHKPEMAIALTDFEAFCGFRPVEEIRGFLQTVPEFAELVGEETTKDFAHNGGTLKNLFSAVMNAPEERVAELADKLVARAKSEGPLFAGSEAKGGGKPLADLLVKVNSDFPQDIGLFCGGLMLNYCQLKAGDAMFLRAKDPHAYINGNIIECMAASDNVVRAGFTPKFKDVPTLVDMLTYSCAPVEEQKMKPENFNAMHGGTIKLYEPPIDEFSLVEVTTPASSLTKIDALDGPAIFIVTQGEGKVADGEISLAYEPGFVFFVPAKTSFEIHASSASVSYHAISV